MKHLTNSVMLIVTSSIKKNKSQFISFFILTMISALLMNLGISIYSDCLDNFDRKARELNAEDGIVTVQDRGFKKEMVDYLKDNDQVKNYDVHNILLADSTFHYNNGDVTSRTVFFNQANPTKMGKSEIIKKSDKVYENGIYVPYILNASGGYKLGDEIKLNINQNNYTFTIQGFFDNIYFGCTNLAMIAFYLPDPVYQDFIVKTQDLYNAKLIQYQLKDGINDTAFMSHYYSKCTELAGNCIYSRAYYSLTKSVRNLTSNIGGTLIIAFSLIILVVSLIIVRFRINNNIEEDMQNIGAMKATGYTTKQIRASYLIQFALISLTGIIIGIILSLFLIPVISALLTAQSGMIWDNQISIIELLITVITILGLVFVTVLAATRKIKHLYPIVALRNGINTHNFKKNHFAIAKTPGNIHFILSLKALVQNIKQNISIFIIMIATTFSLGFAAVLYYNISANQDIFISAVGGELADVQVTLNSDQDGVDPIETICANDDVKAAIYWNEGRGIIEDSSIHFYISNDFSKTKGNELYKGRYPKHDNEIAIGPSIISEFHKKIGDTITCSFGDRSYTYIITGFVQSTDSMGFIGRLTNEGYRHLDQDYNNNQINIYLKKGVNAKKYISQLKQDNNHNFKDIIDVNKVMNGLFGVYKNLVTIIGSAILVITCIIVALILYLMTKSYIIKNKTELGIQKALGYSSKSLKLQTALSFIPIVFIGTLFGILATKLFTNSLLTIIFKTMGIISINMCITPGLLILINLFLTLFALIVVLFVSRKINKISPVSLINE